jgi:hypothetical protein
MFDRDETAKLKFHLQNILSWAADLHVKDVNHRSAAGTIDVTMRKRDLAGFQEAVANARKDFPDIAEGDDL